MSTPAGDLVGDAHINVNANTDPAARALRDFSRDADGRLRDMRGRFVSESRLMGTAFNRAAGGGRLFDDALRRLKRTAITLSPALIPIAAQAAHLAPVAASLGAASVAVGAFAAAAAGQVSAITEAAEAEKKYKEAVGEHGATSAKAAEAQNAYVRQVQKMPPETRTAAAALSVLKDQYQDWSDSLASSTMPVVTKSFQTFGAVFPKLTPLVEGTSRELDRFVTIAAGGVASPGFDQFMQSFTEFATGALAKANDALIRFMRTADTGQISGGVAAFMEYARENGPLVRDALSNVAQALGNLLEGAANVGPGLLAVINALAGIVAAVPPGAITAMLQLALALKAVRLAAAAMAAASAGMAAFSASIAVMRTAAAGATGVLPRLAAAFGTLSRAAKVAVAGTGIGLLVIALNELSSASRKAPVDVDRLTTALGAFGRTGKVTGELKTNLSDLSTSIAMVSKSASDNKFAQWASDFGTWVGIAEGPGISKSKENVDAVDKALANLVRNGQADLAAASADRLQKAWVAGGGSVDRFKSTMNDYRASLADAKFEQQLAADAMGLFGQQAQSTSEKLAAQKASADGLRLAIQALNDVNRAGIGGMIAFEASIDAAAKAAQENAGALRMVGGQLDLNSPRAQAAATALNDLAQKTDEAAGAAREQGQSWSAVNGIYERGRQQLIQNAIQMGLTRDEAQKLASQILKTPNKTALLKADITDWKKKIGQADKQLKSAKGEKKAKLTADIADWRVKVAQAERQLLGAKATKQAKLTADIKVWKAKVAQAEQQLKTAPSSKKAKLTADIADLKRKIAIARGEIASVRGKSVTVSVIQQYIQRGIPGPWASGYNFGRAGGLVANLPRKTFPQYASGGPVQAFPHGGFVEGPGTPTSDSVLALLGSGARARISDSEFIVNAEQTRRFLPLLQAINSGRFGGRGLAGGGLAGAGAAAGAGLASGMSGAVGMVMKAAQAMAAAVVAGIRKELQIASPSRKTRALAKDVGAGFIKGLTDSRAKIKSVAKDLAKDIRAAFSGRRESGLLRMVKRETKDLLKLADQRDKIAKRISDAKKFAADVTSRAAATGSIGSIVSEDFAAPKLVKQQMRDALAQIKQFTENVKKLAKRGVNKTLLRQILELGPEQGAAFAQALTGASKATIKEFNSLSKEITGASSKLGKTGADLLFDSGKKAGEGFLAGLKAQQKKIEKLMLDIAKGMQKAIRKALGIKSPSRVMAEVGGMTVLGLSGGIAATVPAVDRAMARVADAVTAGVPDLLATPRPPLPRLDVGSTRATRTAAPATVNITLNFDNHGVIGSRIEVENWLARALDQIARTGRIPATLRAA